MPLSEAVRGSAVPGALKAIVLQLPRPGWSAIVGRARQQTGTRMQQDSVSATSGPVRACAQPAAVPGDHVLGRRRSLLPHAQLQWPAHANCPFYAARAPGRRLLCTLVQLRGPWPSALCGWRRPQNALLQSPTSLPSQPDRDLLRGARQRATRHARPIDTP